MTPSNNSQAETSYGFFDVDLWMTPIDSIDDVVDTTFKMIQETFITINGLTVRDLMQIIYDAGGKDYRQLVEGIQGENYDSLIKQLDDDIKSGQVTFWHLTNLLKRLLELRLLPLKPTTAQKGLHLDFQAKQVLSLYSLCSTLNNFLWNKFPNLIPQLLTKGTEPSSPPPLHLLRASFRQMSIDCEIMQRALIQRRGRLNSPNYYMMSSQSLALLITDKLAYKTLAPLQHLLPSHPQISVITFFSETTHIHHLPYSDQFILVGISYDCAPPNLKNGVYAPRFIDKHKNLPTFEFMAIPHEIGHYIYHQARLNNNQSFANLESGFKNNAYSRWCEEIFADMYGCLVAGPLSALGMQALLAYGNQERLWLDDEEHPTPFLRPFIMSEILRVLSEPESQNLREPDKQELERFHFAQVADQLDANWITFLQQCGFQLTEGENGRFSHIKLPNNAMGTSGEAINVSQIIKTIRPIMEEFAKQLFAHATFAPWQPNHNEQTLSAGIPWSQGNLASLSAYDQVMADLTNMQAAGASVPNHILFDAKVNYAKTRAATPEAELQLCLDNWGDSGPTGGSGGTH
ncbi:MAG: hypothetical protein H6668_18490 [Ardenticatenaceae bacterium]|nr:hypothetical protein [Ardenticatenaceae bacterium]